MHIPIILHSRIHSIYSRKYWI